MRGGQYSLILEHDVACAPYAHESNIYAQAALHPPTYECQNVRPASLKERGHREADPWHPTAYRYIGTSLQMHKIPPKKSLKCRIWRFLGILR